jgi:L-ascorbate metabolism protein UlaG (beta-lactamase superfamily)
MKITKFGQCCLLIEIKGKRILTDPGSYSIEKHSQLEGLDAIFYTHEHQDHYHLDSLKVLIQKNPQAIIFASTSVSELLEKENIIHTLIRHNESVQIGEITVLGFGEHHAMVHSSIPLSANTGFFIDNALWYPGDSFTNPERPIDILALPVTGPWLKISESVDYALALKPRVAFPIHDFKRSGLDQTIPAKLLPLQGIEFVPMIEGDSKEF